MKKVKNSPRKKERAKAKQIEEPKKEIKIEEIIRKAEKEIKSGEIEDLDFDEFSEELELDEGSPSLGRINASPRGIINLEEDLSQHAAPVKTEDKENDSFKYSFGGGNAGEPKYIQYENASPDMLPRTELENFGRTNLFERREAVGFRESAEAKPTDTNFEKYNPANKFDEEKQKRDNIVEKRELKYTPSR